MRVIAGTARGRPLLAPKGSDARPTTDLVKGMIFSMLEAEAYKRGFEPDEDGRMAAALAWPRVLDLFAGSGALGIEALSRGAEHAHFFDRDAAACRAIRANLDKVGLAERARVHQRAAQAFADLLREPVDAVFLDAPYVDAAALEATLDALDQFPLLRQSSIVVVEQGRASPLRLAVGSLRPRRTSVHGGTQLVLFGRDPAGSDDDDLDTS